MPQNHSIQVISRAAEIMRALAENSDGQSLGQISKQVKLPRSTVQRIVAALITEGFISTNGSSGGIMLGPEIQSLAQAVTAGFKDRIRPMMKSISKETGETVDLAILEGNRMRFIDQIVGGQRLRTVSRIGDTFPLTNTANGKAALASLPVTEATKLIINEFEDWPDFARPLPDLLVELEGIQGGALARDDNEHTEGVSALGFAISDPAGEIYAVSVPVPSSRFARIHGALTKTLEAHQKQSGF
ncbi:IclR family transcriptional regulator [Ruegeria arenilitoris]|uniref:IclR family transcriptional regulator n=1 Tax=Ruegeria arenilitoris TaxID=1173585 RepID=UPI0014799E18|nr:IclR family transcriptional regulator [Ruegeria arenilitoris]